MRIAWTRGRTRDRRRVPRARAGDPRRARRRAAARSARRACSSCCKPGAASTIAYRRRLIDSPSYTLNHEEVEKALEEGIRFAEGLTPLRVDVDRTGTPRAARVGAQRGEDGDWNEIGAVELPARTILIAAGTQPNTVLAREDAAHFMLDGNYFQAVDEDGKPVEAGEGARQADATCAC